MPLLLSSSAHNKITVADTRDSPSHTSYHFSISLCPCRGFAFCCSGCVAAEKDTELPTPRHARSVKHLPMATPHDRRTKGGSRKTLSSRISFRYTRSNSAAAPPAAARTKSFGSVSSLIEPRTSAATSGESETSSSTLESSPAPLPLGERLQSSRETRSFTVAVVGNAHSRCQLATGGAGDEAATGLAAATAAGGPIQVAFEGDEFSSTGGKRLGLTVSPAKGGGGDGDGLVPTGARIDQLPRGAGAGEEELASPVRSEE